MIPSAWKVVWLVLLINIGIGLVRTMIASYNAEDLFFGASYSEQVNMSEYYSTLKGSTSTLESSNPFSNIPIVGGFIDVVSKMIPTLLGFLKSLWNFLFALPEFARDIAGLVFGPNKPITNFIYWSLMGVVITSYGLTIIEMWRGIKWSG